GPAPGPCCLEPGPERRDFLALRLHQFAQRVEILALDEVHVGDEPLRLRPDRGLDLTPHPVGDAGGVVHQAPEIVENPAALVHRRYLTAAAKGSMLLSRPAHPP